VAKGEAPAAGEGLDVRIAWRRDDAALEADAIAFWERLGVLPADVAPARPQAVPHAAAPVPFTWSGFYIGLNGGYGWGRSNWRDPATDPTLRGFGLSGGVVGGQLGYNWQTGPFVLGLESDLDWTNLSGSRSDGGVCGTNRTPLDIEAPRFDAREIEHLVHERQ